MLQREAYNLSHGQESILKEYKDCSEIWRSVQKLAVGRSGRSIQALCKDIGIAHYASEYCTFLTMSGKYRVEGGGNQG